jgi:hypothetical protein
MREMSSCVCVCKPQNLGIHQAGPRYYWYSPCVSTLRICDFRVFFRSRFRASKTAATNRHTTVCDRSWPPFLGSPGGPYFEIGFLFHGLETQRFIPHRIPGRARSLPPPPPPLFAPPRPPSRLCIACFKLRTCIGSSFACFALRACIGTCIACFEL